MEESFVRLKQGKESIFTRKHQWIFSGAIESFPSAFENGSIAPVASYQGQLLGYAYFNRFSSLSGRIISFGQATPEETLRNSLNEAINLRKQLFSENTTAYRLVNGEGDYLPGLIIDRYGSCLVVQIGTLGMEKLKEFLVQELLLLIPEISGIYEKSSLPSRKEEKIPPFEGVLYGDIPEEMEIKENGLSFLVSIQKGQKTGFFLDQRQMRHLVYELSYGKKVLNCFCYTGGFTVAALKGGALHVDSVDASESAATFAKRNVALNGFDAQNQGFFCEDVFDFFQKSPFDYDLVILDPPAFAKRKEDQAAAIRGYLHLNREVFKRLKPGSFLTTCSCSYHIDETTFHDLLYKAALLANRRVKILSKHRQALDHPVSLFHPESNYLKSFLFQVM